MDELTLEQQAKRMNLIKKAQRKIDRENIANLILRNPLVEAYFDLVEAHERVIKEKEAALDRGSIFNRKEVDYCLVKVLSAKLFVIYKMIKIAEEEIEKHKYDLVSSPTEF